VTVQIVEIIGRADQGVTKPFICRGDDGELYFVKGRGAGKRSLVCEWIAGSLALRFGLPVAPFTVVEVPASLIELGSRNDLGELGVGTAFGSLKARVMELSVTHLPMVSEQLQRDVLAFDWWIRNGDRTLSATGGNPNLFWDIEESRLVVLDHNQAFDTNFSVANFVELHAFSERMEEIRRDWVLQQQYCTRFVAAMEAWDDICNTLPGEWWFIDDEQTLPVDFNRDAIKQQLLECDGGLFWNLR
jgi:hypothetical protein